ncbi:hypothetical protein BDB01DRAFT_807107 [Pilobolus umbonatus]|nr:hypothetical protein BDB01DRAFT_807107 [Pilobolus umbonatus]
MTLVMWGWVQQRCKLAMGISIWKRRYLVITTRTFCMHKSEKGVIASLYFNPMGYGWPMYKSVEHNRKKRSVSIHPRDPKEKAVKFRCMSEESMNKWIQVIREQIQSNTRIWVNSNIEYAFGSVLDRLLYRMRLLDDHPEKYHISNIHKYNT